MSTTDDHVAIRALIMRAALAPDQGDLEEYRDIYTPDGSWAISGKPADAGVDAIIAAAAGRREKKTSGPGSDTRHLVFPMEITIDGDSATGTTYLTLVGQASGSPTIASFGVYTDSFVRTAAGWRIKDRVITPEAFRK